MKSDLIALGCTPKKTYDISFPVNSQLPQHLQSHFVRGYFDGDGCITTGSTSKIALELLGTKSFLLDYMKWTGLHYNSINSFKHSDIKRVSYSGPFALKILNKMYDNATIYLERKHKRYLIAVQSQVPLEDSGL